MGLEHIWMGFANMGLASGIDGRMGGVRRPGSTPYKNQKKKRIFHKHPIYNFKTLGGTRRDKGGVMCADSEAAAHGRGPKDPM